MLQIGLTHYLILSAAVFCIGLFVMMTKRNAIGVLIGAELALNACNINLVAFSRYQGGSIAGQVAALFVIVLAAGGAAMAVAICVNYYKNLSTVDVDRGDHLRG